MTEPLEETGTVSPGGRPTTSARLRLALASLVALVVVLWLGLGGCSQGSSGVLPGTPAPDFTLSTLDGGTVALGDLRDRPVLINFWATWCPPCRLEMPLIEEAFQAKKAQGLVVLAVDIAESRAEVERYIKEGGYTFPVVLDADGSLSARYRVTGLPETFLVDRGGIIRFRLAGAYTNTEEIIASLAIVME